MILRILLVGGFLAAADLLEAAEEQFLVLKVGSEVYSNVTVTSVSTTEIFFTHSRGIGNAKLKNLEPALQKHFHFDSTKAAAQQSEQAKANALYTQTLRNSPPPKRQPPPEPEPDPPRQVSGNGIRPHPIHAKSFLNQPAP